jgi:hypothetical protein
MMIICGVLKAGERELERSPLTLMLNEKGYQLLYFEAYFAEILLMSYFSLNYFYGSMII